MAIEPPKEKDRMSLENINPDRIDFIVWSFSSGDSFNIDGKNLTYVQLSKTHHGLQCNHEGGTAKHRLIQRKMNKVAKLLEEVELLNEV